MPSTSFLPLSPGFLRLALILCQAGMLVLAVIYLRRRKLPLAGYLKWGLFAALVPFLGPFLVIYTRPGSPLSSEAHTSGSGDHHTALYDLLRELDSGAKH